MKKKSKIAKNDDFEKKLDAYIKIGEEQEEAQSRKDFIDDCIHIITGGSWEWFKCRINDKLDLKQEFRKKWEEEWRDHLYNRLTLQVTRTSDVADKSKYKAMQEVYDSFSNGSVINQMHRASNTMGHYTQSSKIKMNKVLDHSDINDFLAELKKAINDALSNLNVNTNNSIK